MSVRLLEVTDGWTVVIDCGVWAVGGLVIGYLMHRRPPEAFATDHGLTRLRDFEADGRWYERRWRIRRWKDRLPEAGGLFAGGFAKRSLGDPRSRLDRFVLETRRAERTHWYVLALGPLFVLWNPLWLALVMNVYALAANVPCLVTQRYNRARLLRVQARRARSAERSEQGQEHR